MKRVRIIFLVLIHLTFIASCSNTSGNEETAHYLTAHPQYDFNDRIDGYGWKIGGTIELSIDNPENGIGVDYSDSQTASEFPEEDLRVRFFTEGTWDLSPGDIITLSDGRTTIEHVLQDFSIEYIDIETDTIGGLAEPGSEVIVAIDAPYLHELKVTANASENWLADFSDITDIIPASIGKVMQSDSSNHLSFTVINWTFGHLHVEASLVDDNIGFYNFTPFSRMTFEIYSPDAGELIYSETIETDEVGHAFFENLDRNIDLVPETTIFAKDITTNRTAELVMRLLSIKEVDSINNSVSGEADPHAHVIVYLYDTATEEEFVEEVIADGTGDWKIKFNNHIVESMDIFARIFDDEGDETSYRWID